MKTGKSSRTVAREVVRGKIPSLENAEEDTSSTPSATIAGGIGSRMADADIVAEIAEIRSEALALGQEGKGLGWTSYLKAWHALHRWANALPQMRAREVLELQGALRVNDTVRFAHLLGELEGRLGSGSRSPL
jgi:hypothetical protein